MSAISPAVLQGSFIARVPFLVGVLHYLKYSEAMLQLALRVTFVLVPSADVYEQPRSIGGRSGGGGGLWWPALPTATPPGAPRREGVGKGRTPLA